MYKALGFVFLLLLIAGCTSSPFEKDNLIPSVARQFTPFVCFESGKCVEVEIASTSVERAHGLMSRPSLDENAGMFFEFEEPGLHGFWMKDTLIPLDMIWINDQLEIVDIQTAQPCISEPCEVFTPKADDQYVLEINAGSAQKWGIQIGQHVELKRIEK